MGVLGASQCVTSGLHIWPAETYERKGFHIVKCPCIGVHLIPYRKKKSREIERENQHFSSKYNVAQLTSQMSIFIMPRLVKCYTSDTVLFAPSSLPQLYLSHLQRATVFLRYFFFFSLKIYRQS